MTILRLGDNHAHQLYRLHEKEPVITGSLEVLAKICPTPDLVIFPGEFLLTQTILLPKRLRAKERSEGARFALEESLCESIDNMHVILGKKSLQDDKTDAWSVAAMNQGVLDQWISQLRAFNITSAHWQVDYLCLPLSQGWTILLESHRALVRLAADLGFACPLENLQCLLSLRCAETPAAPQHFYVICADEQAKASLKQLASFQIPLEVEEKPFHVLLQDPPQPKASFHFVAEQFNPDPAKFPSFVGYMLGGLIGIWLVLSIGFNFVIHTRYTHAYQANKATIARLYRSVYPEAKKITSPRLRISQDLKKINQLKQHQTFFDLLATASPIIKKKEGIAIKGLEYENGRMQLHFALKSFKQLDEIEQTLQAKGLMVNRPKALQKQGKVEALIQLWRKSP